MNVTFDINYVAVLVAALSQFVIGMFWYSPLLFGNVWMKLMNVGKKEMEKAKEKGMAGTFTVSLFGSLVSAYVLAHFVDIVGSTTVKGGAQLAFWIWLGFIATTTLHSILWENKPVKLYLLNNGYLLVSLGVMSVLLSVWV